MRQRLRQGKHRVRNVAYILAVVVIFGGLSLITFKSDSDRTPKSHGNSVTHSIDLPVQQNQSKVVYEERPSEEQEVTSPLGQHGLTAKEVVVADGDSLSTIFERLNLNQTEMYAITKDHGKILKKLHPGQSIIFHTDKAGRIEKLLLQTDELNAFHFTRTGDTFNLNQVEKQYERRPTSAHGVINSSLFIAGQKAGLPDKIIMELTDIFAWDVDFVLDIRQGDRFSVIFEELYKDNKKVKSGKILAAEFVNQGNVIRALRYTDGSSKTSYYTPDGSNMRKAFLRSPVKFSRISSHFDPKRKHPILNTIRAHRGVDYAAPKGTPIMSTGNGKVVFVGTKGGYGRTIEIRHGSTYSTLYAHLSKYASGIKTGSRVVQGQTIGYVGSSGLSTGPHLHYEFRVRGVHKNPLKVTLPKAEPINPEYKSDFVQQTRSWINELNRLSDTQLASRE